MNNKNTYLFALNAALIFAAFCIFRFFSMLLGANNLALSGIFSVMTISLPFVLFFILKRVYVVEFNRELPFRKMASFSVTVMIYSQIILKLIEYIFFKFVSPTMLSALYARSTEALLSINSMKQMGEAVKDAKLPTLTQYLFSNFSMNILIYLPLVVVITYLITRKKQNSHS